MINFIKRLSSDYNPPSLWLRYVDDVYAIIKKEHLEQFHEFLNTISASIKFTKEIESSGSIAFLDVWVTHQPDGAFST